ncbi:MAG: NUDIX hydrolase [Candidatus Paceibacterota bacterium]|jgi:8-oxo-dGTP pyrophosphatase MutT (NUDIX family)
MPSSIIKQRIAGRAVIVHDGNVLIIRESHAYQGSQNVGKYDFPGGKVEPGESLQEGLLRETKEECGLDVTIGEPFFIGEWRPEIKGEKIQIFGVFFRCFPKTLDILLGPDHDDYQWIDPRDYNAYNLIPLDCEVLRLLIKQSE